MSIVSPASLKTASLPDTGDLLRRLLDLAFWVDAGRFLSVMAGPPLRYRSTVRLDAALPPALRISRGLSITHWMSLLTVLTVTPVSLEMSSLLVLSAMRMDVFTLRSSIFLCVAVSFSAIDSTLPFDGDLLLVCRTRSGSFRASFVSENIATYLGMGHFHRPSWVKPIIFDEAGRG